MIFIVGSNEDPHIKSVANHLSYLGAKYVILDRFNFEAASGSILQKFGNDNMLHLGAGTSCEEISAIWWRQKPPFVVPSERVSDYYDSVFTSQEWTHVLRFLELKYKNTFAINDASKAAIANNKLYQLDLAKSLGFSVPKTLITNNYNSVNKFIEEAGSHKVIFKTLNAYMNPTGILTYTNLISKELILEKKASISIAPGIYQEFVNKKIELRITIVGQEIFAAKVLPIEGNTLDWRKDVFEDIFETFTIPQTFKNKLLELHKAFGLFYGAYDFILDDHNNYVFLEVNPSGQWLWLERKLNFPISVRIAEALFFANKNNTDTN